MRRRIIEIIITEDMEPVTEELFYGHHSCSQVAYKIKHGGEQYGSYIMIDSPELGENQILDAATGCLMLALEAYRELEKERL